MTQPDKGDSYGGKGCGWTYTVVLTHDEIRTLLYAIDKYAAEDGLDPATSAVRSKLLMAK